VKVKQSELDASNGNTSTSIVIREEFVETMTMTTEVFENAEAE
jgi:hypothetical protein